MCPELVPMSMAIIRLRNLPKNGFYGVKMLCDQSGIPERNARYLAGIATELEMSGSMNTYLLIDP